MLFPGLQGHSERRFSIQVFAQSDDPPRDLAFIRLPRGEKSRMRPAVTERDPESLTAADNHIRPHFTGCGQKAEAHQVGSNGNLDVQAVRSRDEFAAIKEGAIRSGVLQQGPEITGVQLGRFCLPLYEFYVQGRSPRFQQGPGLGKDAFRNKKPVAIRLFLLAASQCIKHGHCLSRCGALVEEGCVGKLHPCKVGYDCLKIE